MSITTTLHPRCLPGCADTAETIAARLINEGGHLCMVSVGVVTGIDSDGLTPVEVSVVLSRWWGTDGTVDAPRVELLTGGCNTFDGTVPVDSVPALVAALTDAHNTTSRGRTP